MIYIDRYKQMKCNFEDIQDAIDYFHEHGDYLKRPIHEMLGLTVEEYEIFVTNKDSLKKILYDKYHSNTITYEGYVYDGESPYNIADSLHWHMSNSSGFSEFKYKVEITPVNME